MNRVITGTESTVGEVKKLDSFKPDKLCQSSPAETTGVFLFGRTEMV